MSEKTRLITSSGKNVYNYFSQQLVVKTSIKKIEQLN